MARQDADREDLMREATALVQRAEWTVPGESESIVAGFRSDGRLSIFVGPDPAYHFDHQGGLRRAFVDGALYRTAGERLSRLDRSREGGRSELHRSDLTVAETELFFNTMTRRLAGFQAALVDHSATLQQSLPVDHLEWHPQLMECISAIIENPYLAPAIVHRGE